MAERRMFAKAITNSAKFLRLDQEARLLYYDLGMNADDDGVVEAFTVIRTTNATEKALETLSNSGFVAVLNEDLVTYITGWEQNNFIRKDRYRQSFYADLLERYTNGQPMVNQWSTQDSIGKDSLGKDSKEKESKAVKPPRTRFIPPSVEEVRTYCMERGNSVDPERFVDYYTSNGWMAGRNKMKDWKAAVRTWENNGFNTKRTEGSNGRTEEDRNAGYTWDLSKESVF